jgi:hypothetical protein
MHPTESEPEVHEAESQAAAEPSPEATDEQPSPSWWQRIANRFTQGEEDAPSPEEAPAEQAEPDRRTLTDTELQRLIQSEADKREAARNKAARDAERKRLRDEDPWALAEIERQEEQKASQDAQVNEVMQGIARIHDSVTLIPMLEILEPAEKERLLQLPGAGEGVDGRRLLTVETLKALEKHWKAQGEREAEAKLRRNPTFRKQVMSELNGGFSSPEPLPSGSATRNHGRSSAEINDMFRQQVNLPTSRE